MDNPSPPNQLMGSLLGQKRTYPNEFSSSFKFNFGGTCTTIEDTLGRILNENVPTYPPGTTFHAFYNFILDKRKLLQPWNAIKEMHYVAVIPLGKKSVYSRSKRAAFVYLAHHPKELSTTSKCYLYVVETREKFTFAGKLRSKISVSIKPKSKADCDKRNGEGKWFEAKWVQRHWTESEKVRTKEGYELTPLSEDRLPDLEDCYGIDHTAYTTFNKFGYECLDDKGQYWEFKKGEP
ncbi:hypothetical protein AJ80_09550 [Polytolypa hystricis UAMH7299]|uniref:Uncharacterized protein n=1 Tax=Polytolypa hystricis (strain UAMH7299) TaxID=1447883 RepID=A0A2B7WP20_POLH7|nr:hypothetical protein AJ80_09550 [Polytolypa hystricis UAMH7299]